LRPATAAGAGLALVAAISWPAAASRQVAAGAGRGGENSSLVEITNGTVVLGVIPELGGRVVLLKTPDGPNLLASDEALWRPPFPAASLETPFQPWNGRIVWVGPQTAFWSQQDRRPDLKAKAAGWPPDPFNETARFETVERTPGRLRLRGPASPVTGLSLEHDYEIVGPRTVRMKVTATNRRETKVAWDLWPNTRVRPEGWPYVPLAAGSVPRVTGPKSEETGLGTYPTATHDGWLTLAPGHRPKPPQGKLWAKAFVRPARGVIAFFYGRQLLLVRAPLVPKERLHPEQAMIELYRGASDEEDILELEMHSAYETLAPGATMSFEQTFEIVELKEPAATLAAHLGHLRALD
jgi:hypothetical protein